MNNVLGTTYEMSLRCLLILEKASEKNLTIDMIACIDFISVYGKDFGIHDENLHGDNNYKFSEFAFRREKVSRAMRKLILDGLVTVHFNDSGFLYSINDSGLQCSNRFESNYAKTYGILILKTLAFIESKSEREITERINTLSVKSARRVN